jgi:hypothetical protein
MMRPVRLLAALGLCAGALVTAVPAQATAVRYSGNLVLNARGLAGVASVQGWDAVTIPGWRVAGGLPTVVRYGTKGFDRAAVRPAPRLFAGGAGGTATLTQSVPLAVRGGTRYRVSAWLGGTKSSWAQLRVRFLSARGRTLAGVTLGPARRPGRRATTGVVPARTTHAQVSLVLATSLKNYNGPDAPTTGYNRAVAADPVLRVSAPVAARRLLAPRARVPRFQHVFLFYFENEDFHDIVGNTRQAPYFNSLLPRSSLLGQFYAEEHPSDANYLALAGGSTFGVPLDDPEEENPLYTIRARNLGDEVDAAHETWRAYLQSAAGPCDDTVHGYYWNDDLPMLYFADVRDRPAYCASHMLPLESLPADLAKTSTTPNFAWVSPDDCADMETCGIRAGDDFLKTELTEIMRSPAWRTQRSLAIITFDEDAQDYQHPAQRVPTIVLGSAGVRRGYVSSRRYTHYSLLRTIEAALGLGTLTANDRYAQPVNDIFTANPAAPARLTLTQSHPAPKARPVSHHTLPLVTGGHGPVAWVANYLSGTVTPVAVDSRKAGRPIRVGSRPRSVAIADGTVYVANSGGDTVTPISEATGKAGPAIRTGTSPWSLATVGRTVYVANSGSGTVTPITAGRAGKPIRVGLEPRDIVVHGSTAYVLNWGGGTVTPITAGRAGRPIPVGHYPVAMAFRGSTGFVANFGSDTVTPVRLATGRPGPALPAGYAPDALTVSGGALYVVDGNTDTVTMITAAARRTIKVGYSPVGAGTLGRTSYVVNSISGTLTPVTAGRAGRPISVGLYAYPTAVSFTGTTAIVLDTYAGQVSLVDTASRHVLKTLNVGGYPQAMAISG